MSGGDASHWTLRERLQLTESLTQIQSHLASISEKLDAINQRMIRAEEVAERALRRTILHEQIVVGISFAAATIAAVYKLLTMF